MTPEDRKENWKEEFKRKFPADENAYIQTGTTYAIQTYFENLLDNELRLQREKIIKKLQEFIPAKEYKGDNLVGLTIQEYTIKLKELISELK
jgi:hypothetical protein